jgi:hypothetical protein
MSDSYLPPRRDAPKNPIVRESDIQKYLENLIQGKNARDGRHQPTTREIVEGVIQSPFVSDIVRAARPRRFVEPTFKLYDGKSDPVVHLKHYLQRMSCWQDHNPSLCRSFASSLGEKGLEWFQPKIQ